MYHKSIADWLTCREPFDGPKHHYYIERPEHDLLQRHGLTFGTRRINENKKSIDSQCYACYEPFAVTADDYCRLCGMTCCQKCSEGEKSLAPSISEEMQECVSIFLES